MGIHVIKKWLFLNETLIKDNRLRRLKNKNKTQT